MVGGLPELIFLANSRKNASAISSRGILEADGVRSRDQPSPSN